MIFNPNAYILYSAALHLSIQNCAFGCGARVNFLREAGVSGKVFLSSRPFTLHLSACRSRRGLFRNCSLRLSPCSTPPLFSEQIRALERKILPAEIILHPCNHACTEITPLQKPQRAGTLRFWACSTASFLRSAGSRDGRTRFA